MSDFSIIWLSPAKRKERETGAAHHHHHHKKNSSVQKFFEPVDKGSFSYYTY
jgi:hypothetical protein